MKKILIFFVLLASSFGLQAQISEGGMPPSFQQTTLKSATVIPALQLQTINTDELLLKDHANGTPFRYGVAEEVDLDLKLGLENQLDSGNIWRYEVSSDNAKSIKLIFNKFVIPPKAKLFVYDGNYSVVFGAFTSANVNADSSFAIADFPGNNIIVEYYEPFDAEFSGVLHVDKISQSYRNLGELISSEEEGSTDYIDVNCSEGINWQLEKHAVCKFTFIEDMESFLCSGALINNVNNDGTPYFLTANHCVSSSTVAKSVTAYFNYETKGCGMTAKSYKTLSGASLLTTGENSDFTLLKLTSTPPANYQPYYAGWDLTTSSSSTVGIHHPEGIIKKISLDNDPPVNYGETIGWENRSYSPANTHWEVYFDKGMTAGGSSGSPLFNQDRRIIGQLHGGGDYDSYYGKLNYSWVNSDSESSSHRSDSGAAYAQLKEYLAGNSAATYIDGYSPSTNLPEAVFKQEFEYACVGSPVKLTDYSVFNVSEWQWEFTPSTVTFLENTNRNSQNPIVSFDAAGRYSIKLVVENSVGKDSVTHTSAVVAGSKIVVSYTADTQQGSCLNNIDSILISASGALTYNWELSDGASFFKLGKTNGSEAVISKVDGLQADSTVVVEGLIIGHQGTCSDTSYFAVELTYPFNDNISDALLISKGKSGPYTNACAGVESNEPAPPVKSCTTQIDWCDEYGSGLNIVENSVWFCFNGPATGAVSVEADSMDGQIALYKANSYIDILNGNYTLLAANDDISSVNSYSKIKKVAVTPGKMYWLQFDGSGGGTEGRFYIILNEEIADPMASTELLLDKTLSQLTIYPQPASDYLVIKSNAMESSDNVLVQIYNLSGSIIYSEEYCSEQNSVRVSLDKSWPKGVYVVAVTANNTIATGKFIKQ